MLHPHRRGIAAFSVWALLVQTLALVFTVLPPVLTPANAAGPEITVTKDSPVQILAGENVRYSITVTNSGDMVEYNASISDVLPFGATYAGNPSPASAGPPRQSVDAVSGRAILIWENLADLGPGNTYTLEFDVDPGVEGDTVGNSFENNAYAAASTQQRDVPDFDESGVPIPAAEVQIDDTSLVTEVTALEVRKTNDNSPEGELLRGVHDNRSTYTLEVEANKVAATDDVILVDFLPASLEFLACGDGDNTTGGAEEYPGSGPLGSPALVPSPCPTPASVSTIAVPPAFPGLDLPAGTYTRVEWNLGTLAPGSITQVKFVAGIPVQRNTTAWPNGEPDPASLAQGSNLDNNTGPSTRELSGESSVINVSTASGIYQGPTIDGDPAVRANGSNRVTVEDLRMRKSASPDNAVIGEIVTFSITVDTSEYVSGQDIVITDTLPDGLCPLAPGQNFDPGQAPECVGTVPPTVPYDTVTYDPGTGGYDIVFEPVAIAPQGTLTVEFQALLRFNYNSPGPRGGLATVAGDSFTNTVALSGTTVPIDGIVDTGEVTVGDESSVTIGSDTPSISKQMKPRVVPMDCSENVPPGYDDPENLDRLQKAFRQGDLICFKLRVDFPATIATEDYVVSDFLPVGTEFLPGSFQPTANNTAAVNAIVTEPRYAEAVLGTEVPGSGRFVVPAGAVFEAVFGAIVLAPAPGPQPDLVGNLLKTVHQNTDGSVFVDRDSVDFEILPSANVSLQKGVYAVDAPPAGPNGPDTDGSLVQEQSQVTYRLDISNAGLPEFPDGDFGVLGVQAWDVLPLGLACDSISNYQFDAKAPTPNTSPVLAPLPTDLVTCTDPGDANHPTVDPAYGDSATQSIIVWQMPTPDLADTYRVNVGETLTLTYDLRMPDEVSVSSRFDNTAGVAEFRASTNRSDDTAPYYPANNIDGDITPEQENAPAANDPSYVITDDAGLTKTQTTSITETNNNTATQATIGEEVDYTVEVTIPARTAVYDAVLSDPLPRDGSDQALTLVSATATGPAGPVLSTTTNPDVVTLTFPPVYQNDTDQPQVFGFQVTARVADISRNTHNRTRTNTATFTSNLAPGGAAVTPRTASSTMTVVEPSPSIVKSVSPTSGFGGQEVIYTIESSNANGRPPAHDTVVTDCLPPQLNWGRVLSNTAGPVTVDNGDGTNGCPPGVNNRAQWQVGTVLPGTANIERLTFTGQIIPTAIGGTVLTNTVDQTSSTLADGTSTPGNTERVYDRNTSADVTVVGTINSKGVTPEQATIGETVTYTVSQRVPELTVFFQFSLIDQLPAGLDPAVKTLDVSCTPVGPGCDQIEGNAGYGTPLTSSGQTIGWYFGDVAAVPGERIVSVTYSTTVQNLPVDVVGPPNQAGATPTNSARPWWTVDPRVSPPTSVLDPPAAPGARAGTPVSAVLNLREPKLAIEKQVSNATPQPGDPLDFTVEVSNPAGTTISEAFDISLSDDVPAGIVVDPTSISDNGVLTGADPVTGGGTITWAAPNMLGPLAPGESVTLTYSAALAPSENLTGAPLQNTATIDSYSSLPDGFPERRQYSGPSSSAEVTPRFPEVTTVKTATNGEEAFIDKPFSWTLAVTNTGTGDALAVDATDTLPTNFCYLAGSATIALPGAPTVPVEPDAIPSDCTSTPFQQALTWTDFGDLAPGETARITLQSVPTQAVVNTPGVGLSIPHTNSAVATGQDPTGATGNADGSYSGGPSLAIARIAAADLQLVKSAVTPLVVAGQTATFTMDVVNQGPDPSLAPFVVADRIPLGTTVVTATGPGWVCINADQLVNCVADAPTSLAPGASLPTLTLVITIPKDAPDSEVYENSATVRGPSLDTNLVNNTDTALVTAIRVADLQITKTTASQPIVPGEQVTYDLVVANNGPSDAQQPITVTDTLPVGLSYVSAVGTGWNCSAAGQDITCVRGQELTASAPDNVAPTIAVTADLDPAFTGDLTNTTVVTGVSPDPVPENNTSTVVDPAAPQADLFVEKSTVSDPLVAGAEATYTLGVGNLGPSVSVAPITVTDALPAGLTYRLRHRVRLDLQQRRAGRHLRLRHRPSGQRQHARHHRHGNRGPRLRRRPHQPGRGHGHHPRPGHREQRHLGHRPGHRAGGPRDRQDHRDGPRGPRRGGRLRPRRDQQRALGLPKPDHRHR